MWIWLKHAWFLFVCNLLAISSGRKKNFDQKTLKTENLNFLTLILFTPGQRYHAHGDLAQKHIVSLNFAQNCALRWWYSSHSSHFKTYLIMCPNLWPTPCEFYFPFFQLYSRVSIEFKTFKLDRSLKMSAFFFFVTNSCGSLRLVAWRVALYLHER